MRRRATLLASARNSAAVLTEFREGANGELCPCAGSRPHRRFLKRNHRYRCFNHVASRAGVPVRAEAGGSIMAIAALMSNVAKVMAWWREVDWWAFVAYSITGIPAAALGAHTLLVLPSRVVDLALGLFFLMMIPGALAAHVGVMEAVA